MLNCFGIFYLSYSITSTYDATWINRILLVNDDIVLLSVEH